MAVDICRDYGFNHGSSERLHMLCILKGGHQFFSDLSGASPGLLCRWREGTPARGRRDEWHRAPTDALKKLTLRGCTAPPLTFDFVRVKSYAGTESSGAENTKIESIGVDLKAMAGRHILLVEDIIDTGNTMAL